MLLKRNTPEQIHFIESLIRTSDGARITGTPGVRINGTGQWADGSGTLGLEETDQWFYIPHTSELSGTTLAISLDHGSAIGPIGGVFDILNVRAWWHRVGGVFNEHGGRIWYVSTSGSSSNYGTQEFPFATIANALSVAVPGDTIHCLTGSHSGLVLPLVRGLIFEGDGEGTVLAGGGSLLDGFGNGTIFRDMTIGTTSVSAGIGASGCPFVAERCVILGDGDGVNLAGCPNVRLIDCEVIGKYDGMISSASQVYAENCRFSTTADSNQSGVGNHAARAIVAQDNGGVRNSLHLVNCQLRADRTNDNDSMRTAALEASGSVIMVGGSLTVSTTSGTHDGDLYGYTPNRTTSEETSALFEGVVFNTSSAGAGDVYDIDASDTGAHVTVLGCKYSSSKINGLSNLRVVDDEVNALYRTGSFTGTDRITLESILSNGTGITPGGIWNYAERTLTSGSSIANDLSGSTGAEVLAAFQAAGLAFTGSNVHSLVQATGSGVITGTTFNQTDAFPVAQIDNGLSELLRTGTANNVDGGILLDAINAISAGGGATAQEVWEYATRTLTEFTGSITGSFPTAQEIWEYATRELTSGSGITVESSGSTGAEIWAYPTRTLTSGTATLAEIAQAVWQYVTRTLTSGTFTPTDRSNLEALIARLTAARAGYLDNLNISGLVASANSLAQIASKTAQLNFTGTAVQAITVATGSGAITGTSFNQITAFPLAAIDNGLTELLRSGTTNNVDGGILLDAANSGGGSSLTQQQIRDAMTLAATLSAEAGSLDAKLDALASGATVTAAYVDPDRTWWFQHPDDTTAANTIYELIAQTGTAIGFNGLLAMNFERPLPDGTSINRVEYVDIQPSGLIVSSQQVSADHLKAVIGVNTTGTALPVEGLYNVAVTIVTEDSQQITRQGRLYLKQTGT